LRDLSCSPFTVIRSLGVRAFGKSAIELLEFAAHDLPSARFRQIGDELNGARNLIGCEMLAASSRIGVPSHAQILDDCTIQN